MYSAIAPTTSNTNLNDTLRPDLRPLRRRCLCIRESLGSLIYGAKRNRRRRWTMIYRPGINCGYVRLPEVVTPYMRTARGRDRGKNEAREGREELEKSGGIHSYDRRRRRRRLCIAAHIHTYVCTGIRGERREGGRFINFWDSRWNPRSLETRRGFIARSVARSRFRWVALFTLSLFFFFEISSLFFPPAYYAPAGNLINRELFVTPAADQATV